MTDAFKAKFAELCEAEPEKFETDKNIFINRFWIKTFEADGREWLWKSDNDREYLWFLHKLAEALGGVVWVEPAFITLDQWVGYYALQPDEAINHPVKDTQTLALESAVIGLMEWYLNNKKGKS